MSLLDCPFLAGVIEGFNGRPWNARQRHQLFGWMSSWKLNTYIYAAKGDLKHHVSWQQLYADIEVAELASLIRDAQRQKINFIYSLRPGIANGAHSKDLIPSLENKVRQVLDLGCQHFALLFDDVPELSGIPETAALKNLAETQCTAANQLAHFTKNVNRESSFFFCPSLFSNIHYAHYLGSVGEFLDSNIEVLWTGPRSVSETISSKATEDAFASLRRKPVLWDNLYANDCDPQQIHLGPYSGRSPELKKRARGISCNLNCQFEMNFVPLRSFALFLESESAWDSDAAYLQSMQEWLNQFATDGDVTISRGDLELLGDLFYLPFKLGRSANAMLDDPRWLLRTSPRLWDERQRRYRDACQQIHRLIQKLSHLKNREIFFALFPSLSSLKTRLAFIDVHLDRLQSGIIDSVRPALPAHLPQLFDGNLLGILQELLHNGDGNDSRSVHSPLT